MQEKSFKNATGILAASRTSALLTYFFCAALQSCRRLISQWGNFPLRYILENIHKDPASTE
jgi:hypothetical protein